MRERNTNTNFDDEDEDEVSGQVRGWVEDCTRYLDFVWGGHHTNFQPLTVSEALKGPAQLKICDPYGYVMDPPLCNK